MSESIHGHEVMQMMIASGKTYTKESLEAEIIQKFGPEARFHTCSAENMSASELVDFLNACDKFINSDEGFSTDPDKICDH
jgi:probable metal-binding protein